MSFWWYVLIFGAQFKFVVGSNRQRKGAAKLHHLAGHAVLIIVLYIIVDFSCGRQKLQRVEL